MRKRAKLSREARLRQRRAADNHRNRRHHDKMTRGRFIFGWDLAKPGSNDSSMFAIHDMTTGQIQVKPIEPSTEDLDFLEMIERNRKKIMMGAFGIPSWLLVGPDEIGEATWANR